MLMYIMMHKYKIWSVPKENTPYFFNKVIYQTRFISVFSVSSPFSLKTQISCQLFQHFFLTQHITSFCKSKIDSHSHVLPPRKGMPVLLFKRQSPPHRSGFKMSILYPNCSISFTLNIYSFWFSNKFNV